MTPENVKINLSQTADTMLKVLDNRSKDIIVRRFGLKSDKQETLESIGREYGITRERVRQIEANAKKALASLNEAYVAAQNLFTDIFVSHGGILAPKDAIELIRKSTDEAVTDNVVNFFLEIIPGFSYITAEKLFAPHWRLHLRHHAQADAIVQQAMTILKKHNHPVSGEQLVREITSALRQSEGLSAAVITAVLGASKHVALTAFNEWGLVTWAETHPRGVGDKAYVVLRRHNKPAHFREITDLINAAGFDHKQANAQTVHNELIKDSRFVLVGRGLYGLKEWGYMTGTVADVLATILEKSRQPLSREELIDQVLKQRLVKKNTILLSLQNNSRFRKVDEDHYTLRQGS